MGEQFEFTTRPDSVRLQRFRQSYSQYFQGRPIYNQESYLPGRRKPCERSGVSPPNQMRSTRWADTHRSPSYAPGLTHGCLLGVAVFPQSLKLLAFRATQYAKGSKKLKVSTLKYRSPFFPMGIYHVKPEDYPRMQEIGFNTVQFWMWEK